MTKIKCKDELCKFCITGICSAIEVEIHVRRPCSEQGVFSVCKTAVHPKNRKLDKQEIENLLNGFVAIKNK